MLLVQLNKDDIHFDMVGFDYPFVNAIRRILLAEVPTMAIETVHLFQNTSVMHDAFLCHRLGLIPIKADAKLFENYDKSTGEDGKNAENTLVFDLNVHNPSTAKESLHVFTDSLKWEPIDSQSTFHAKIEPVEKDILLTKLAPSQRIEAKLYCHKGIGKDHAKFSPVAACHYKHLATLALAEDAHFEPEEMEQLKTCFPPGYLDLDGQQPVVKKTRIETSSILTFNSCPSLKKKILIAVNKNVLACKCCVAI